MFQCYLCLVVYIRTTTCTSIARVADIRPFRPLIDLPACFTLLSILVADRRDASHLVCLFIGRRLKIFFSELPSLSSPPCTENISSTPIWLISHHSLRHSFILCLPVSWTTCLFFLADIHLFIRYIDHYPIAESSFLLWTILFTETLLLAKIRKTQLGPHQQSSSCYRLKVFSNIVSLHLTTIPTGKRRAYSTERHIPVTIILRSTKGRLWPTSTVC
ncbi:hypothetical protein F4776DRAFT_400882 [Hypoxylon sp. NC0597]|nr:hypothetical protein F4776DRAFT_400882 [Hypoxylon sp. NC0597]